MSNTLTVTITAVGTGASPANDRSVISEIVGDVANYISLGAQPPAASGTLAPALNLNNLATTVTYTVAFS